MGVRIRRCELADLDALRTIAFGTFDDTFRRLNDTASFNEYLDASFSRTRLEAELKNPDSTFFFLYSDDLLAGYMKINRGDAQTDVKDPSALEIERIYVTRDFQGLGLGRALIDKALETARAARKKTVWLGVWEKNENAIAFYRKMGFSKTGTHDFFIGKKRQTDFIMRRNTAPP
ncbi:MAG TPA: GNAT family N-acetyltransferase [Spirochaetia bacterium]|nr:GNAT family N-acetyltransferase [Spirochaetia bacterium]